MTPEQIFRTGLDKMGLQLDESAIDKQLAYLALLHKWNQTHNLTAVVDIDEMVTRHLLDSLAVLACLPGGATHRLADVGTGAGLPGIPLAIACPLMHFVLIDSASKRTRFLTQVKIELSLYNVEIINKRVEEYRPEIYFDVVIARAFAPLDVVLNSTRHLFGEPGGNASMEHARVLLMQGRDQGQFSQLPPGYRMVAIHKLDIAGLDAQRHLLEIQPDTITS